MANLHGIRLNITNINKKTRLKSIHLSLQERDINLYELYKRSLLNNYFIALFNKLFDIINKITTHNIYKKRQKVEILLWSINLNTTSLSTLESYIQAYRNKKLTIERQCAKKIIHTIYIKTQTKFII